MASNRWRPGANPVAQVNTITPANVLVTNTFSVKMGLNDSKVITYTAAAATVADVVAGLVALLSASTVAEFAEVTWTANGTSSVVGTSKTPGVPFTQTSSAAGGTATLTTATPTANTGPNNWDAAANWSLNAVPVNGDDVYLEDSTVPVLYGLAQSAVTLASLNVLSSFTGTVGLPEVNAGGYPEYRAQFLAVASTVVTVGEGAGQGSGRIKLDAGAVATTVTVRQTGTPAEQDLEAFLWKGTHASNVVNVLRGSVALAGYGGDVSTVATLRVGYVTSPSSDAQVRVGSGCTLTAVQQEGGVLDLYCGATTVTKSAGTLTAHGTGAFTTVNDDGGTTVYLSSGTCATFNVGGGATLDLSQDMRAKTFTNVLVSAGGTVLDPFKVAVYSTGIKPTGRVELSEVTLAVGFAWTVSP